MKRKLFISLMTLVMIFGNSISAFAMDFSAWDSRQIYPPDIVGTENFASVRDLMNRRIVTGDHDGLFHPNRAVTRAEFGIMMARATNNTAEIMRMADIDTFFDLEGFVWARPYINAAAAAGLFRGRSEGVFAPADSVTYAEVVTALLRMNRGTANAAEAMGTRWPDNVIAFAEMINMTGGMFIVNDWSLPATRGHVAMMLHRTLPTADVQMLPMHQDPANLVTRDPMFQAPAPGARTSPRDPADETVRTSPHQPADETVRTSPRDPADDDVRTSPRDVVN